MPINCFLFSGWGSAAAAGPVRVSVLPHRADDCPAIPAAPVLIYEAAAAAGGAAACKNLHSTAAGNISGGLID